MSKTDFNSEDLAQLARLDQLPDHRIDTQDIPEAPDENWIDARRSELYRPIKQPVTMRLDADILTWFKVHAPDGGYQTEINRVLRHHVSQAEKRQS